MPTATVNIEEPAPTIPDLIVGVDFGMTGTAVAYAGPQDLKGTSLFDWPGVDGPRPKIASAIAYEDGQVSAWGFDALNQAMPNAPAIHSCFKGVFDDTDRAALQRTDDNLAFEAGEPERWVTDYLRELYAHIRQKLEPRLPKPWAEANLQFWFSFPTTWRDPTRAKFRRVVEAAGFGVNNSGKGEHHLDISINEAEAAVAACFENKSAKPPAPGDNLLVADIGGGTCDVGIFMVTSVAEGYPQLQHRISDQGVNTGSHLIDRGFEERVRERLMPLMRQHQLFRDADHETVAAAVGLQTWDIGRHSTFLAEKCRYGENSGRLTKPHFSVQLPHLPSGVADNDDGGLKFDKRELFEPLFEEQCSKIWQQIEAQIANIVPTLEEGPATGALSASYDLPSRREADGRKQLRILYSNLATLRKIPLQIILTGGMGSSAYVRGYLTRHFEKMFGFLPKIYVAEDPQLAVSTGLVKHALRALRDGGLFLYTAKQSYGIRNPNKPSKSIRWFIQKDQQVKLPMTVDVVRKLESEKDGTVVMDLELVQIDESVRSKSSSMKATVASDSKIKSLGPLLKPLANGAAQRSRPPVSIKRSSWMRGGASTVPITTSLYLSRGSIACSVTREGEQVGEHNYFTEEWHHGPIMAKGGPARGEPGAPEGANLKGNLKKANYEKIGLWIAGLGIAVGAAFAFWQVKREDEGDVKTEGFRDSVRKRFGMAGAGTN